MKRQTQTQAVAAWRQLRQRIVAQSVEPGVRRYNATVRSERERQVRERRRWS